MASILPSGAGRLRIVVLGYIVRFPLGGMAWHYLQYVLGLAKLGHEVCFVEDSDDYPCCYNPARHVTDAVTRGCWVYQRYIRRSRAEFAVVKHGYVAARTGWFSERSACYLASGRPVVVQDTGFSDWLSSGAGVLAFTSPEEAQAGIAEVDRRYAFHSRAAREIAAFFFNAHRVLPSLIERAVASAPAYRPPPSLPGASPASP